MTGRGDCGKYNTGRDQRYQEGGKKEGERKNRKEKVGWRMGVEMWDKRQSEKGAGGGMRREAARS